jgi:hypothetical protein
MRARPTGAGGVIGKAGGAGGAGGKLLVEVFTATGTGSG